MREQGDAPVSRREFLVQGSVAVASAGFCVCGLGGCATITGNGATSRLAADAIAKTNDENIVIDLGKVPTLATVGGAIKVVDRKDVKPIIIARVAEASFVVASIKCPHRGVEVEYHGERKQFVCASIGSSTFGLNGALLSGPAKKPIQIFDNIFADGKLTIRGVAV